MKIDILTLFPGMFQGFFTSSLLGKAIEKKLVEIKLWDIRDYTLDKHNRVDDTPYGGGPGMVMSAEPVFRCLDAAEAKQKRILYLSPKGRLLDKHAIEDLSAQEGLVLLCGHYEGIDERILEAWDIEEISIGDYVLTGGEPAAMVLIDAVTRMLPGLLGNEDSHNEESIYSGLLEYPQYTKPREYQGLSVPEVLTGGNHRQIHLWQFERALILTRERRPDLFQRFLDRGASLPKDERKILEKVLDMM